jgi:hypothetical protein
MKDQRRLITDQPNTALPRGARFFRADLHIHSNAGSHDVSDTAATPEAIVTTAAQEGLKIIQRL